MTRLVVLTVIGICAVAIYSFFGERGPYKTIKDWNMIRGVGYLLVSAVLVFYFRFAYVTDGYWNRESTVASSEDSDASSDSDSDLMDFYVTEDVPIEEVVNYHTAIDVTDVEATSSLSAGLAPDFLIDWNTTTSWQEGVDGDGVGESVTFYIEESPIAYMVIFNGNQRDENSYWANYRPSRIQVVFRGEAGAERQLLLPDSTDPIIVKVDNSSSVTEVTLTIDEVYTDGASYEDTCISEVEFFK